MRFTVLSTQVKLLEDFDVASSGLGLRIASMLGKQLGGTLTTPHFRKHCSIEFTEHARLIGDSEVGTSLGCPMSFCAERAERAFRLSSSRR